MIEYCTSIDLPTGVLGFHCCHPLMASYTSSREQCLIASIYFILFEYFKDFGYHDHMYFNIILWCFRMVPSSPCLHSCGLKDIISHLFLGLLSFPWYLVSAFPPLSTWVNVQLWCRLSATALQCPGVRISQWMLLEEWGEVLIFRNSTGLSEVPKPFMKTHTFALFINPWLVSPI